MNQPGLHERANHGRGALGQGEPPAGEPSGRQGRKGGLEIGLEMEKGLKTHQLHSLDNPGIAHHQELDAGVLALLRQLHQNPKAGGIDEINAAEVNHYRQGARAPLLADEGEEILVGIGIQLARKAEQQATSLLLRAAPQGDGQTLQINDRSCLPMDQALEV